MAGIYIRKIMIVIEIKTLDLRMSLKSLTKIGGEKHERV